MMQNKVASASSPSLPLAVSQQKRPAFLSRADLVSENFIDSYVVEKAPALDEYLFFHGVLDRFCWLLRLQYSEPSTVRSKRYRLDTAFQRLLLCSKFSSRKASKCQAELEPDDLVRLERHLTNAWHNELVRSDPLDHNLLDFGTTLSASPGPGSGGLVGWNVIQSYYAFFEFISCLTLSVDPAVDTRGHRAVAKAFANHVVGRASDRLLFYPFTITSRTRSFPRHPDFNRNKYARYPRDQSKDIGDLEVEVQSALALLHTNQPVTILDLLYELRLWANYTGVASLLALDDGGYQKFLMKNLAAIVYCAGGMAELAYVSAVGEEGFLHLLEQFSTNYVEKHERFSQHKHLVPSLVRLRSFLHLGIITADISFALPRPQDSVQFISLPSR